MHATRDVYPSSAASFGTRALSNALLSLEKDNSFVAVDNNWDAFHSIPPFRVNSLATQTGEF